MVGVVTLSEVESILEVYSLEEILDENDLTIADALFFLVENKLVELPNVRPLGGS